ncbi:hypothetical protein ABIE78_005692 [Sinorhizobium fredii]
MSPKGVQRFCDNGMHKQIPNAHCMDTMNATL